MLSLCFHLLRLCLALECGLGERESARVAPRLLRAQGRLARARDVWQAWSPHHDAVRAWLDRDLRRTVP